MRVMLIIAAAALLAGCMATKIVTFPVKVAAKTVEAAVDAVD